jgi:hypothetical protein
VQLQVLTKLAAGNAPEDIARNDELRSPDAHPILTGNIDEIPEKTHESTAIPWVHVYGTIIVTVLSYQLLFRRRGTTETQTA